jgi:hypothetical protein
MASDTIPTYNDPLDVLRRFMPAPFQRTARLGSTNLVMETNDADFLQAVSAWPAGESSPDAHSFLWKLVRDPDAQGELSETMIVMAGPVILVCMGPACVVGVDRERKELLGFIGASVNTTALEERVLPLLMRLTAIAVRDAERLAMTGAASAMLNDTDQCLSTL